MEESACVTPLRIMISVELQFLFPAHDGKCQIICFLRSAGEHVQKSGIKTELGGICQECGIFKKFRIILPVNAGQKDSSSASVAPIAVFSLTSAFKDDHLSEFSDLVPDCALSISPLLSSPQTQ